MDQKAIVDFYTGLYIDIEDKFEKKTSAKPTTEVCNCIFDSICKRIISDLIGKQRQGVPPKEETRSEEKPTEKQIAYAEKLGCHFAETLTRRGLSKWIDEHKND